MKAETAFLDAIAKAVGLTVGVALLYVAAVLVDGWVLSIGWRWFLVPIGAPVLTFWQLLGIAMVVRLLRPMSETPRKDEKPIDWFAAIVRVVLFGPLFTLGTMWAIHALAY